MVACFRAIGRFFFGHATTKDAEIYDFLTNQIDSLCDSLKLGDWASPGTQKYYIDLKKLGKDDLLSDSTNAHISDLLNREEEFRTLRTNSGKIINQTFEDFYTNDPDVGSDISGKVYSLILLGKFNFEDFRSSFRSNSFLGLTDDMFNQKRVKLLNQVDVNNFLNLRKKTFEDSLLLKNTLISERWITVHVRPYLRSFVTTLIFVFITALVTYYSNIIPFSTVAEDASNSLSFNYQNNSILAFQDITFMPRNLTEKGKKHLASSAPTFVTVQNNKDVDTGNFSLQISSDHIYSRPCDIGNIPPKKSEECILYLFWSNCSGLYGQYCEKVLIPVGKHKSVINTTCLQPHCNINPFHENLTICVYSQSESECVVS